MQDYKTHASVVAKVKELQVDATSGIVRNENGQEIAQYPDLAVEKNKSGTESVGQGAKSLESPKHKDSISHGHSSKDHIKDRDTHSTGAAVTGGVAGTAAASAAAATAHGKSRNEPTASTHGQSCSRAISDAGTDTKTKRMLLILLNIITVIKMLDLIVIHQILMVLLLVHWVFMKNCTCSNWNTL